DRRAAERDRPQAGRHTQQPHPDPDETQPHHRRLRPARLPLPLHRPDRRQPGRSYDDPQADCKGGVLIMRVMAQIAMVMHVDTCIGCHTCSVTCKQAWTNRQGTEYVWFNNVETKPGMGYPRGYEDQEVWKGGWEVTPNGRLKLK